MIQAYFVPRRNDAMEQRITELSANMIKSTTLRTLLRLQSFRVLELNMQDELTDEEAKYFFEELKNNTSLTSLNFIAFDLSRDRVKYLSEALKVNTSLTHCKVYNDAEIDALIFIANCLKFNSSLTHLIINNNITKTTLQSIYDAIKINTSLTHLDLSDSYIGPDGVSGLCEALKVNSTITCLNLYATGISDEGTAYLSEALKSNTKITHLTIAESNLQHGMKCLSEALLINTTLTYLNIGKNSAEVEGVIHLSNALKVNTTLTQLVLSDNYIPKEGIPYLCKALEVNTSLTCLSLAYNTIGVEGTKQLSDVLKTNKALIQLNLQGCDIRSKGVFFLCEALKENTTLRKLQLRNNRVTKKGASYISELLKAHNALTYLDLSCNFLKAEGVIDISKSLKYNTTLTILKLRETSINEGISSLCESLRTNSTLTQLNIAENNLGETGARLLSEVLKVNSSITCLQLHDNNIGTEGVKHLSEVLKVNTTLVQLDIQRNNMDLYGGLYLAEALRVNSTLTAIDLRENCIHGIGEKALCEVLKVNFSLKKVIAHEMLSSARIYTSRNDYLESMKLPDNLISYLIDETLTDIILQTNMDGGTIKAHKIVLAARSSFFRSLLAEKQAVNDTIKLENISYPHLRILLNYIYSGKQDENVFTSIKNSEERAEFIQCASTLVPEKMSKIKQMLVSLPSDKPTNASDWCKDMMWAVNNSLFHDVVFLVGDGENTRKFFAHKVVLCAHSTYFTAMLMGGMKEAREHEIRIPMTNPEAFAIVLEYLYTKDLNVARAITTSYDIILHTFLLACMYSLEDLKCKLECIIASNITEENVCSLLELANAHHAKWLKSECEEYIWQISNMRSQQKNLNGDIYDFS